MNPRQRRGLVLIVAACVGALLVFTLVSRVIADVKSQVGPLIPVLVLNRPLPAYTPIDPSAVEVRQVPRRWLSATFLQTPAELSGKVAATDLAAGSYLERDMVADRPQLSPGEREIAILVNAETGVAGKIHPDSYVDIFATFAATDTTPAVSRIIVSGARTVDVGHLATVNDAVKDGTATQVVPITFALSPLDAQRVAYAESFAVKVRLAVVAPDSTRETDPKDRTYSLEADLAATSQTPGNKP
ncbi:pilus assembly protein CpaB [Streptomyces sp. TLI_235]|nr:Flp pilus assembly protein CpaB [Streptomyces sp. TLI_235]PBC69584.1 pilus assembly protein CpaB [Streptomyces sp. TLI_235]